MCLKSAEMNTFEIWQVVQYVKVFELIWQGGGTLDKKSLKYSAYCRKSLPSKKSKTQLS